MYGIFSYNCHLFFARLLYVIDFCKVATARQSGVYAKVNKIVFSQQGNKFGVSFVASLHLWLYENLLQNIRLPMFVKRISIPILYQVFGIRILKKYVNYKRALVMKRYECQVVLRSQNYLFSAPTLTMISAPAPAPATAIYWHLKLF